MELLLRHGVDPSRCPGLLTRAVRERMQPEVIVLLLDAGLDPNYLPPEPGQETEMEAAEDEDIAPEDMMEEEEETQYQPEPAEAPRHYALPGGVPEEPARPAASGRPLDACTWFL